MPGNSDESDPEVRRASPVERGLKRALDIGLVLLSLPVCLPLALLVAAIIRIDSPGRVIYSTQRVGRRGRPFRIFKFRTMVQDAARAGPGVTFRGDPRVTRVGRFLRRTKFDEFPQVINVLRGEMSIVGPRPEAPDYVARYTPEQRVVLEALPGLTSLAQVAYRDEEDLLPGESTDEYYVGVVMPKKLALDIAYVRNWSLLLDIRVFLAGLAALFRVHTLLGLGRLAARDDTGRRGNGAP